MREYFKVVTDYDGEHWLIASLGREAEDNKDYYITTNFVRASELHTVSGGAKSDAHLIAHLLNKYLDDDKEE